MAGDLRSVVIRRATPTCLGDRGRAQVARPERVGEARRSLHFFPPRFELVLRVRQACALIDDDGAGSLLGLDLLDEIQDHRADLKVDCYLDAAAVLCLCGGVAQHHVGADVAPFEASPFPGAVRDGAYDGRVERVPLPSHVPLPQGRFELEGIAKGGAALVQRQGGGDGARHLRAGRRMFARAIRWQPQLPNIIAQWAAPAMPGDDAEGERRFDYRHAHVAGGLMLSVRAPSAMPPCDRGGD